MLRAFFMSLTRAASHWLRNEPTGSITTYDGLKTKFLNKYFLPTRTTKKMEEINNFQQEPDENLYQAWERFKELLMKCPQYYLTEMQEVILFYNGLGIPTRQILDLKAIQAQLNNLGREIKKVNEKVYAAQVGCEQCKGSHYTKDFPLKEEELYTDVRDKTNDDSISKSFEWTVKYPKGIAENVLVRIGKFTFPVDLIFLDMPEDIKVPLILGRPFLSTTRAKIDVYKRKITLRVGEERIVFISVKPASSLIKRVYMLSLKERMELDLEARLMGETLVLNRSLDSFFDEYIELKNLNEPFELKRNQGDNLMPTIEEGEVIEEFRTRDDQLDAKIDNYPRALMNVPIFVGTFSVVTDFVVLENMDAYRDEGMGDVIFGESCLREVGIYAKWFEGMITIYNGNNEVTYQMVRSHPRFKHHTNEQCNKIPPLLKVSQEDKMNGISHPYQKLKGFYKGVLNLGPDYIRDAKIEELLTRGHISVNEME
ncbi:hypothetical protein Tco_0179700 [Tanacetum coccineum]